MLHDLRLACRSLSRARGFTLVTILTLALGIGANTAIFSGVYAVLLRPLPYPDSHELVSLRAMVKREQWERRGLSLPDFRDYRAQAKSFSGLAAFQAGQSYNLTGDGEAARLTAEMVSAEYFSVLGVQPALGRAFAATDETAPGQSPLVILSDDLWRTRYAADPAILGRQIKLSEVDYTVIGVMPAGYRGLYDNAQAWVPMTQAGAAQWNGRSVRWHDAVGRLRPGVTLAQANAELRAIGEQLAREFAGTNTNYSAEVAPLREEFFGELRQPVLVLMGAVGFVLFITCANVANLMLVRLTGRRREIAVRAALGAGRARLVRLFLAEAAVIATAGGLLALFLAVWLVELLARMNPGNLPAAFNLQLQWPVLGFALAVTALTALAIGILPAWLTSRVDPNTSLKDAGRSAVGASGGRLRAGLVVGEIALSLALLCGSALFVRSFLALLRQSPGYRTEQVLSLRATLPSPRYTTEQVRQFGRVLLERAQALPGVQSAALTSDVPLDGFTSASFYTVEGGSAVPAENEGRTYTHAVSPDFFRTVGIRFVAGESFAASYPAGSELVAVVSESLARRLAPTPAAALGQRFKLGRTSVQSPWVRVIGVVEETKYRGLRSNPTRDPDAYFSIEQRTSGSLALVVHTAGASESLASELRRLVPALDPNVPVYNLSTVEERIASASAGQRFNAQLMGSFALAALFLAALGLYGVVSFTVGQRTQEIGVRMALGARPADIFRLVLGGTGRLVLAGIALGLVLTLGLSRMVESLLFNTPARDPLTYGSLALAMMAVALLAAWLPARRAARVDPMIALRAE
jgi:predicted permease